MVTGILSLWFIVATLRSSAYHFPNNKKLEIMAYTKQQFYKDVAKEATAIKSNATKDEIGNLDFETFDPGHKDMCIYGQMTGNCTNERAAELVFSCCKRYFKHDKEFCPDKGLSNALSFVNGANIDGVKSGIDLRNDRRNMYHFSAMETYILTPDAKNENLISFLKGKTEILVL